MTTNAHDSQRRLPAWFLWMWAGAVIIAAALELTIRTSYQRITLAGILLVAIIVGIRPSGTA